MPQWPQKMELKMKINPRNENKNEKNTTAAN